MRGGARGIGSTVEQYETLRALHAGNGSPAARRRMDDAACTLCVSTGTRDIDTALVAARHQLPGARPTGRLRDDRGLTAHFSQDLVLPGGLGVMRASFVFRGCVSLPESGGCPWLPGTHAGIRACGRGLPGYAE